MNRKKLFYSGFIFLTLCSLYIGVSSYRLNSPNNSDNSLTLNKEGLQPAQGQVLAADDELGNVTFNVPAIFNQPIEVKGDITADGYDLILGQGQVNASNVIYSITGQNGISVTGGQNAVVSFTGLTGILAGDGITLTPGSTPTLTNTGVRSIQGATGAVTFEEGDGIAIDGTKITNDDPGSAQDIFKIIAVDGQNDITAGSNSDTLTFVAGSNIVLTTDSTNKKLTIEAAGSASSGFTDDGTDVRLTTISDNVGIGTATPTNKLHVVGTTTISSTLTLGGSMVIGSETFDDLTGDGLTVSGTSLAVNLTTSGTTGATASNSGLEVSSAGITLLKGCSTGEVLKWNDATSEWECGTDEGGTTGIINVQEGDVTISASAGTLDFLGNDFALTESPAGEINVAIDYSNSQIARKNQNETVTGTWSFSNLLTASAGLTITSGQSLTLGGDAVSDLTGTGLTLSGSTLQTTLGTSVDLDSAEVTGTLPVGSGGTGATAYASGSVVFSNGTILTEDNTNLFWDDTTNRLGIGDNTPNAALTVGSGDAFQVNSSGAVTAATGVASSGNLNFTGSGTYTLGNIAGGASFSGGRIVTATQTGALGTFADGSTDQVLTTNGAGVYSWKDVGSILEPTNAFLNNGNSFSASAILGTNDTNSLAFETDGTTRVTILATGNFGIGDATPASLFTVGSGDLFQVNSSGAIAAATGVSSSGAITFTGLSSGSGSYICLDGANQLVTCGGAAGDISSVGDVTSGAAFDGTQGNNLQFEGSTSDGNETTLTAADPNADRTITLPNLTGTVALLENSQTFSGLKTFSAGATISTGQTFTVNGDAVTDFTGTGLTISAGELQTTLGVSVDLTTEVTGTLPMANGGTGATSFTSGGIITGNGSGALAVSSAGLAGQALVSGGSGVPTWTTGTLTLAGDLATSGSSSLTFTTTGATNITVPTTGTLATLAGNETLTNKTLTSPRILTSMLDSNGNTLLAVTAVSSAVNYLTFANSATLSNPTFTATGSDTNIGLNITTKGTGTTIFGSTTANSDALALAPNTSGAAAFTGSITTADLTGDRTYTFPNDSGTVCLDTGNCAGVGDITSVGDVTSGAAFSGTQGNSLQFEGSTADGNETTLTSADATADNTITLPNLTGTVALLENAQTFTGAKTFSATSTFDGTMTINSAATTIGDSSTDTVTIAATILGGSPLIFEGTSADANETTITVTDPDADRTITIPNATGTMIVSGHTFTSDVTATLGASGTTALTINSDSVALGTDTTGNYVATLTNGNGISGSSSSEGGTPTIALGNLTSDWTQTGAFDIVLSNASSELQIMESAGATYYGTIDVGDLSDNRTFTFPDASGTVCLTTGNCAGVGGTGTITAVGDISSGNAFDGSQGTVLYFEGATADTNEIALTSADPGGDFTITLPALTGTVALLENSQTFTGAKTFNATTTFDGAIAANTDIDLTFSGAENMTLSNSAATADQLTLSVTGVTTDGVDAFAIAYTQSDDADATDTNSAINIALTSSSGDGDALYGIQFADFTGGTATETALKFGTGFDYLLEIEGNTSDANQTYITYTEPSGGDKTITFPNASGIVCLSTGNCAGGAGGSKWTDSGTVTYLTDTTDSLTVGSSTELAKLAVDGDADEIQLLIQGNGTQTSNLVVFENSTGTDQFTVSNAGALAIEGSISDISDGTLTINDDVKIAGDDIIDSGDVTRITLGSTTTFTNTTTVLSGTSTLTASSLTTLNCSDCIDFDDIADSLTLDAGTTIALAGNDLTLNSSGTGDVIFQDNGTAILTFNDSGNTVWSLPAANYLQIDAATTDTTTTAGVVDLNIDAGNAAVVGVDVAFAQSNGASTGTDAVAQKLTLSANDADGDMFGLQIVGAATANAAAGSYEAAISVDNAENTAASMTDAILITSSGANNGITDAIDVSAANINNAINAGANFITLDAIRFFEGSTGTFTVEDTSGNDLMRIVDNSNVGDITATGTLSVLGSTIGLDSDTDADNVLAIAAAVGQASSNLYWGNRLVCDATQANCGWAATGASSPWTTDSNIVNLNTDTDNVTIGSSTALAKLAVDGDTDEIQLLIQGNATQTSSLMVLENSGGTDQLTVSNAGALAIEGSISDITDGTLTINDDVKIAGNDIIDSGDVTRITLGSTTTFTNTTTVLSGTSTLTASSLTTLNCSDCIDFDDMADSLTLDAGTTIALGANAFTLNASGTGDIVFQDNGTPILTFNDSGDTVWTLPSANNLQIDAEATDSTTTTGVVDINVDSATNNNIGMSIDYQDTNTGASQTKYALKTDITIDANGTGDDTVYGNYISFTQNDANAIAYGLYVTGEDRNYMSGNLGIGDTSPAAALTVGSGDAFQVNSSGAIAAATGITSSGTITFSGFGTGVVQSTGGGVLSSGALDIAGGSSYVTGVLPQGNGGTGFGTYTTGDTLYASAPNTLSKLAIGGVGTVLTVAGGVPSWATPTVAFNNITGGTNTSAAMIVGTGSSLNYTGSGTINASTLVGATWVSPGTIGSSTPNTAAFTTLTSTGTTTLSSGAGNNITLGNSTGTFEVISSNIDISSAGAITGATGVSSSGNLNMTGTGTYTLANIASGASFTNNRLVQTTSAGVLSTITDGGTNQVLTTDGAGNISWTSAAGVIAADSLDFTEFKDAMALDASTSIAFDATEVLTLDAASTDTTTTGGVLDFNVDAGNASVIGLNVDFAQSNGASTGTDAVAQKLTLSANDADGDMFGLQIVGAATANAAAGSYEAAISIDNAENTAASMTDAILITSSGASNGITDAIDVSAANINNAINAGANFITLDGIRMFEGATGTLTFEDTSGNDLMTITDNGSNGNVAVTNNLNVTGTVAAAAGSFAATSAPISDMVTITNSGFATTTTGVDSLSINLVQGTGAITNSALNISATGGSASGFVKGIVINNFAGTTSSSTALEIGTGWSFGIFSNSNIAIGDGTYLGKDIVPNEGGLYNPSDLAIATFNDSSALFNYGNNALLIDTSGNVNIGGDTTPNALFTIGNASQFTVNASGEIVGPTNETINGLDINSGAISDATSLAISSAGSTAIALTRSSAGQWLSFNDGTDAWGLYNTAGSPEGALTANTGALSMDTTNGTLYVKTDDGDATGWVNLASGASSPWQTTSNVANLVTSTDNVTVGSSTSLAKLAVDGDTDEIQFLVQGNGTQTTGLMVLENSGGTDQFTVSNAGVVGIEGALSDITGAVLEINDDLKVTGNDIIDSADATRISLGATTTLSNTTTTLSGTTTLTASSLSTFTTAATLSMASTSTLNCADCIDFDDMKDSLSIDAATDINLGANAFTIDMDSTGDFSIRDGTTDIMAFTDSGAISITPTSGQNLSTTLAGAGALSVTTATGSQTYTSSVVTGTTTTSGFVFDATAINTGTGMYMTSDSITTGKLMQIATTGNTLTQGTLLDISSTSTALTTGRLASLDWSPGSTTTATGDLFRINLGSNGNVGNLFNVTDNASSLFSISESAMTSSLPASFTAAGDVAIAYDLQFTNQTASYIKTNAPLYIESGESFESNDLTLRTFNSGGVVLEGAANTSVKGSDLVISSDGTLDSTNIGGTGLLAYGAICADDTLDTADDCIDAARTAGTVYGISSSFAIDDIGENFPTADESIDAGDIVALDYQEKLDTPVASEAADAYESEFVKKATIQDGQNVMGIISAKPGVLLGGWGQKNDPRATQEVAVGLAGRIPVKVTSQNGPIMPGDFIGLSDIPGVGAKAIGTGYVIGKALDKYENSDPQSIGTVLVFIQNMYYNPVNTPSSLAATSPESLTSTIMPNLLVSGKSELSDLVVTGEFVAGNLSITGLSQDGGADLTTLSGPLRIQADGLNPVEIMAGKVLIDTDGNIFAENGTLTAKTVTAQKLNIDDSLSSSASVGEGTILSNNSTVKINTTSITDESKVFVTAKTLTDKPLSVISKINGKSFTVAISSNTSEDIQFSWWIVN